MERFVEISVNPSGSLLRTSAALVFGFVVAFPRPAPAGPNLMAIGDYGDVPFKRAQGRDSLGGNEVIFEFDDPAFDFGRVVVRSRQPKSLIRRDLFVGFNGSALVVGAQGDSGGRNVRIQELEIWLRIKGRIRSGQGYEWEFEGGDSQNSRDGIPAILPMFWADGEQIGAEVTISEPDQPGDGRIQRLLLPHGIVTVDSFLHQTGAAWVVLLPGSLGNSFSIGRFSFREVEPDPASDLPSKMPVPVRYIPIKSVLEDKIARALDRGAEALKSNETSQHFWDEGNSEANIVTTAAAAAALAELGAEPEDFRPALKWLAEQKPTGNQSWAVLTVAARLYALARHGGLKEFAPVIHGDVQFLTDAQGDEGGWSANVATRSGQGPPANPEHNLSFKALLALREARFAGAEVDRQVWRHILQYWTQAQAYDGGFRQKLARFGGIGQATTTTYTAMGAAGLIAALDMASGMGGRKCTSYLAGTQQLRAIERALSWLDANYKERFRHMGSFVARNDPYAQAENLLWLGTISGLSRFHDKDHFVESADELLTHYDEASGMFGVRGPDGQFVESPSVRRTAEALVILGTGASPTVCQRILAGDDDKDRGQHSGDVQHLVRYLAGRRGRQFNWRRTTIDRPVRELVKTPILLLKIVGPFDWSDRQWRKIREYSLAGGSVVIDLTEDDPAVRDAVVAALGRIFPEYALRPLPSNHPLFSIEDKIASPPVVRVIGNGVRDFIFLPEESWSCQYQLYRVDEHKAVFQFIDNLLSYATDGTPLRSAFASSTYATASVPAQRMTAIHLEVGGPTVAYPNLIDTMDRLMQANYRLGVTNVENIADADVVWISAGGEGLPAEALKRQLLAAIQSGRYVFADVIRGNEDWDENFRTLLRGLDPGITLDKLPRSDEVFTGQIPGTQGFDVVEVELRKSLHTRFSTRGRADLYRISYKGRPVGVYSAHDICSGIGYHYYPDCRGVMPEPARHIAMNVFLTAYGLTRNEPSEQRAAADGGG